MGILMEALLLFSRLRPFLGLGLLNERNGSPKNILALECLFIEGSKQEVIKLFPVSLCITWTPPPLPPKNKDKEKKNESEPAS